MAVSKMSETREKMPENSKALQNIDKKTYVIAQEIKLAKVLAGNNKTLRERALRRLKRWFQFRSKATPFTDNDFMRIWKGLFYAMWMSDKPLIQEECAEMIASLVHLTTTEYSLMFFKCGLQTLGNEWFGIDQLRLDKFLMLVRRLLRQGFVVLKNNEWNLKIIKEFNKILQSTVLNTENPLPAGLTMHFIEIYLEELTKVSEGNLKPNLLTEFVSAFIKQLAVLKDKRQMTCISKHIFHYLMRQSELGMDYDEKFKAWKSQGFPGGTISSMQKQELSDDEIMSEDNSDDEGHGKTKILDPRAGHVDVVLPELKFIPKQIIEVLNQNRFVDDSNCISRKYITAAIDEFMQFAKGEYPLGLKKVDLWKNNEYSTKTKHAVKRLVKFDSKLLNKDKKRRKRKNKDDVEEMAVVKKKKNISAFVSDVFKDKLEEFIRESEGEIEIMKKGNKLKNKKRVENGGVMSVKKLERNNKTKAKSIPKDKTLISDKKLLRIKRKKQIKMKINVAETQDGNYQCTFERNSGTWFVYDDDSSTSDTSLSNLSGVHLSSTPTKDETILDTPPKLNGDMHKIDENDIENKNLTPITPAHSDSVPKRRITPIKLENSKTRQKNGGDKVLFKQNEWDVPLKEGETEIFVESKKHAGKMGKKSKRGSLDSQIVKNPFAKPATPGSSSKKVKIALDLNKTQDISDHVAQIQNSPGIPFDANKKPSKPLLKRHTSSPIDPFYKRKLHL